MPKKLTSKDVRQLMDASEKVSAAYQEGDGFRVEINYTVDLTTREELEQLKASLAIPTEGTHS